MIDLIAILVIAIIVGGAAFYIIKAKKSGRRCIGCPDSATCSGKCSACSCDCHSKKPDNHTVDI